VTIGKFHQVTSSNPYRSVNEREKRGESPGERERHKQPVIAQENLGTPRGGKFPQLRRPVWFKLRGRTTEGRTGRRREGRGQKQKAIEYDRNASEEQCKKNRSNIGKKIVDLKKKGLVRIQSGEGVTRKSNCTNIRCYNTMTPGRDKMVSEGKAKQSYGQGCLRRVRKVVPL